MTDTNEMTHENNNPNYRWENAIPHHPISEALVNFLQVVDHQYDNLYFDWKTGGDGDNGETLMFQLDCFFWLQEQVLKFPVSFTIQSPAETNKT